MHNELCTKLVSSTHAAMEKVKPTLSNSSTVIQNEEYRYEKKSASEFWSGALDRLLRASMLDVVSTIYWQCFLSPPANNVQVVFQSHCLFHLYFNLTMLISQALWSVLRPRRSPTCSAVKFCQFYRGKYFVHKINGPGFFCWCFS